MYSVIVILLFLFTMSLAISQTSVVNSKILSKESVSTLFTDSLNKQLGIIYPIRRVYRYIDKSGEFFLVLTENYSGIGEEGDSLYNKIKAFNFHRGKKGFTKKWEVNDFTVMSPKGSVCDGYIEASVWFWTKYCQITDIDNDGLIDPITLHGSAGYCNGINEGRIKLMIFYKGKKVFIRHQNGILDYERNTHIDKSFYSLPIKLQDYIKKIMDQIAEDGNVHFPLGLEDAMKKHKLFFQERQYGY